MQNVRSKFHADWRTPLPLGFFEDCRQERVANRAVPVGVHMPFCQLTVCDPDDPHDPRAADEIMWHLKKLSGDKPLEARAFRGVESKSG
jgi:hypothetical protein